MIRPATGRDAAAITALEAEAFSSTAWNASQVAAELDTPTRRVVVAEQDGALLGYASVGLAGDVADLIRIAVARASRRAGIGSALLAAAHDRAVEGGADRVLLEVAASNSSALAFYAAHGYAEISRRPRYYADGDDALVLDRALA